MSIADYNEEQIEEMSAIELAFILLGDEKNPYNYQELIKKIVDLKNLNPEEEKNRRTRLYTAMNLDGRFVHLGENHWGLREWYPLDQSDEDLSHTVQAPKKSKADEFDDFDDDFDNDLEDIEDELDELSQEEDADEYDKSDELEGFGSGEETVGDDKY
ncbi:DNA-directed RNA polymerase subunit delta [Alteribacillus persepolensis]|uniref:Probable DNA-directed RNA polymerase subunit delta n=1 Tax=Alteribacillus persepolensis TaxID=568899 RepID=A0A1G8G1S5_9BACI|nr:DNA-directed RNA polymerase subunit delta [Alteribacillus persepolensis]SDH88368.1 DNA-directed RNA polymerase subunit delta [Alteribacillus persepolensis]